jgi:hypothetical protein
MKRDQINVVLDADAREALNRLRRNDRRIPSVSTIIRELLMDAETTPFERDQQDKDAAARLEALYVEKERNGTLGKVDTSPGSINWARQA